MKTNIPFQLGMEYENWEFDLEPMQDRIMGYDSYIYSKKIMIFNTEPLNIELVFHWDILVAVILEFEETDIIKLDKILLSDYIQVNNYFYKSEANINSRIYKSLL
ncbi:hypothetical protein [Apibacter adventoris]|uniref:Uncharacterized protein n=1 Tax=Apibacter adventoris TaxID=1679466 RepID=A0A2S8AB49_9FLAO|nr:hypothetical protein [Apibacter adventoris]PQL91677.1 hypothetical protein C4S77_07705 [Apibacter adventoris]